MASNVVILTTRKAIVHYMFLVGMSGAVANL
jgi:hypothetical protein